MKDGGRKERAKERELERLVSAVTVIDLILKPVCTRTFELWHETSVLCTPSLKFTTAF